MFYFLYNIYTLEVDFVHNSFLIFRLIEAEAATASIHLTWTASEGRVV